MANRPPKPPMSPITSGRNVDRTWPLMRSTACSPAPMSTPAPAYVRPGRSGGDEERSATGGGDFAHLLRQGDRHFERVVAGEAGRAEARPWSAHGRHQVFQRKVG